MSEPNWGFDLMLLDPAAYEARVKRDRAIEAGDLAGHAGRPWAPMREELAGALALKKLARKVSRNVGRGAAFLARSNPAYVTAKYASKGVAAATRGVRRRIFRAFFRKLIDRRARFISWQTHRSLSPSPAERSQAQAWATRYVRRRGLLGKLLGTVLAGAVGAEPVSTTLVAASIPVLIAFARKALRIAEREGAPADPTNGSPTQTESAAAAPADQAD